MQTLNTIIDYFKNNPKEALPFLSPFLLFPLKNFFPKLLDLIIFEKTHLTSLGYFHKTYLSRTRNIIFTTSVFGYVFSFGCLLVYLHWFIESNYWIFLVLILLFCIGWFIYFLLYNRSKKEILKKKISFGKFLENTIFHKTFIIIIFIQAIISFILCFAATLIHKNIDLKNAQTNFEVLFFMFLLTLIAVIISIIVVKLLYKDVIIYTHRETIDSYSKRRYIRDTDLDEVLLLLLKLEILRTNLHVKKLMLISKNEERALFIPQDTVERIEYIKNLENDMSKKQKNQSIFKKFSAFLLPPICYFKDITSEGKPNSFFKITRKVKFEKWDIYTKQWIENNDYPYNYLRRNNFKTSSKEEFDEWIKTNN